MTPRPTDPEPTPDRAAEEAVGEDAAELVVREVDVTDKVLLVRAGSVEHADALAPALAKIAKRRKAPVLLVVGDVRVEALDEQQMRTAGWVRADAPVEDAPTAEQLARVIG